MGALWMSWVRQADPGTQVSLSTLGQRLDQRNAAEHTAPFFLIFFNFRFWEQQRDRSEKALRQQSLVSYTLSFNGVNSEIGLCSDTAETYYT